jgi:flagellar biosynthetic protein FlhB
LADTTQDRNQPATSRRREEFKKKGETASSREIPTAILMFTAAGCVIVLSTRFGHQLSLLVRSSMNDLGQIDLLTRFSQGLSVGAGLLVPLFALLVVVSIMSYVIQGQIVFSFQVLKPKFERINPMKRFKQVFFSLQSLMELGKGLFKVGILAGLTTWFVSDHLVVIVDMYRREPGALIEFFSQTTVWIVATSAFCLAGLAMFDRMYTRWSLEKRMKMTRQEVKEEHKNYEGDPSMKSRRRQRHRELSLNRIIAEVPEADVIVTNPTHFAVALKYDRLVDSGPRVTAKGMDDLALKIRSIARRNSVPVLENKPLARTLFKTARIGQVIRPDLFQAVAEVYAFLFARNKNN